MYQEKGKNNPKRDPERALLKKLTFKKGSSSSCLRRERNNWKERESNPDPPVYQATASITRSLLLGQTLEHRQASCKIICSIGQVSSILLSE